MRKTLVLAAVALLGGAIAQRGWASSLEVTPVLIALTGGRTAATIELTNRGDAPSAIQARMYRWSQSGDTDALVPTQDLIVSPPIFTIQQAGAQTLRVLLRHAAAGGEHTYRMLLDEVPTAAGPRRRVSFTVRLSLPVIVDAADAAQPALQWRAQHGPAGQTLLIVSNTGQGYDQVRTIDVTLANGRHVKATAIGGNPYVLPGAERHWIVQDRSGAGGPLHVSVSTLSGKHELTLTP